MKIIKTKNKTALKDFPAPISLFKMLGPSFVILALGLGSGEIILWPFMTANYGLGIAWGAALGITFQFFLNMEIERYALARGESVFVGLNKLYKFAPYWFILSTFVGFGLPGIVAASAKVLAPFFGLTDFKWLAMALLIVIGLVLSVGKTVYGLLERLTKIIIIVGVPFIFVLTASLIHRGQVGDLFKGLVGLGHNFTLLPAGVSLATFLAAFAYAGAGGNLNLSQSIYVKEKGYGMGKYAQKISGLFKRHSGEAIKLNGEGFNLNAANLARWRIWWRRINLEHLLVFWFVGLLAICLLMLLSYATAYGQAGNEQSIQFLLIEAKVIGLRLAPWAGSLFLLVVGIMLWQTQLGIMDSTSRIMAENLALKKMARAKTQTINLSRIYYGFVWAQITFGIILFAFNFYEPKSLIVLGAVINAIAMFIYTGMIFNLNLLVLPEPLRPSWWRQLIMGLIFVFFGVFSGITVWDKLF